jgi:DNA-binding NarL/FixJ family response regulator
VLQLIAEGHSTPEIAERLGLSGKTIGTYREHLMEKLDIHSIAGLTKYAIREGLTSTTR